MTENIETGIPAVYLSDLEKLVNKVRAHAGEENVEIGFEFIIAGLFPTSWKNIQSALSQQYTLGYIQGQKDAEEEHRNRLHASDESDCYCE